MENLKNVAPIEDFNWDAYENGESVASASHEELEKAYDNTLNKVNDREVVDGTVIAMNKREVVVMLSHCPTQLYLRHQWYQGYLSQYRKLY